MSNYLTESCKISTGLVSFEKFIKRIFFLSGERLNIFAKSGKMSKVSFTDLLQNL